MQISSSNLTLHNIGRYFIAMKRKFQMWLFSRKVINSLFKDNDSLKELFDAPKHVKEQFVWRIEMMKLSKQGRECLEKGVCLCGCDVPDLQLANDACEGNCYPVMMNNREWNVYKFKNQFAIDLNRQVMIKYTD